MFCYGFPRTRFVDLNTLHKQIKHIKSEAVEVELSYLKEDHHFSIKEVAEEILDVIHSAKTALRIIEKRGVDIDAAKERVIKKNQVRCYYDD